MTQTLINRRARCRYKSPGQGREIMKLLTKEIVNRLKNYPLYSQDGKKKEAVVVAKFFLPLGAWTWYVMEANLNNNIAYGITVNGSGECEYGYFSLTELQELRATKLGLSVERDIAFEPTKLADLDNEFVQKFLTR